MFEDVKKADLVEVGGGELPCLGPLTSKLCAAAIIWVVSEVYEGVMDYADDEKS